MTDKATKWKWDPREQVYERHHATFGEVVASVWAHSWMDDMEAEEWGGEADTRKQPYRWVAYPDGDADSAHEEWPEVASSVKAAKEAADKKLKEFGYEVAE